MEPASSRIPARVTHNLFRALIALLALAMAAPGLARAATAAGGDREVPRSTGFGGACPKCELSGPRLSGPPLMGSDFTAEVLFFFSSRRRHTRLVSDWSSDVCSSD